MAPRPLGPRGAGGAHLRRQHQRSQALHPRRPPGSPGGGLDRPAQGARRHRGSPQAPPPGTGGFTAG
eukprot:9893490-Lingulodinium_polyedra.AAC.1